jgi:hypothetical protein
MKPKNSNSFADRQEAAATAKKAMLEKFKPKPMVIDPDLVSREQRLEAEREAVRLERQADREARRKAAAERAEAARIAAILLEQASADAKKNERKERKALTKAEQRQRKEDRLAHYAGLRRSG